MLKPDTRSRLKLLGQTGYLVWANCGKSTAKVNCCSRAEGKVGGSCAKIHAGKLEVELYWLADKSARAQPLQDSMPNQATDEEH